MTVERSKQETTRESWGRTVAVGAISGLVRTVTAWIIARWTE